MKKRLFAMIIFIISAFTLCTANVFATDSTGIAPTPYRFTYTMTACSTLGFYGASIADCESELEGYSNVTKIIGTQTLQISRGAVWADVSGATWTKTSYNTYISMDNEKSNCESGTYQLVTVYKVYSGSNYEVVRVVSDPETI